MKPERRREEEKGCERASETYTVSDRQRERKQERESETERKIYIVER